MKMKYLDASLFSKPVAYEKYVGNLYYRPNKPNLNYYLGV